MKNRSTQPAILSLFILLFCFNASLEAQTYVKSEACMACHSEKYNDWIASGHPYKFTIIQNDQPPTYPMEAVNFQSEWLDSLGDGSHSWSDVAGVIGGYGWKTRFVGTDGHIIGSAGSTASTGTGHNQFNFYGGENLGWVDYHPADEKIYNYSCFKCHTTGADTSGSWLEGVPNLGTFSEGGIGCEGCHGPGSAHVDAAGGTEGDRMIDRVYEFAHLDNSLGGLSIGGEVQLPDTAGNDVNFLCGSCHNRSYTDPINSSGGFVRHHEQWDEFVATKHSAILSCVSCHDPHKRVIWDGDGITKTCESCHGAQESIMNHPAGITCIDCHMPFAAKSGAKRGVSGFRGDVRSHLMAINVDTASMFTADGSAVKDDDERSAALSPHFSCLGCHNNDPDDNIADKTIEEAVLGAANMHNSVTAVADFLDQSITLDVYPNPAIESATIHFSMAQAGKVNIKIFNAIGDLVFAEQNTYRPAGDHTLTWNGLSNIGINVTSGMYFVNVGNSSSKAVKRFILTK